jgi:hypothetical protein
MTRRDDVPDPIEAPMGDLVWREVRRGLGCLAVLAVLVTLVYVWGWS